MIREQTLIALHNPTSTSPVRHKKLRFGNIVFYPYTVSDSATLRQWKEAPNKGDAVDVPNPLPSWWWEDSAEALDS